MPSRAQESAVPSNREQTKAYRPQETRDVTAELAAFEGRGTNGRSSRVTEDMRAKLPTPSFNLLTSDSGASIEELLVEQTRQEQERSDRQTYEAQQEYQAFLEGRQRRGLPPPNEQDCDEHVAGSDEPDQGGDDARPTQAAIDRLFAEARAAADRVSVGSVRETLAHGSIVKSDRDLQPLVNRELQNISVAGPTLTYRTVTLGDVDRLWDWLRRYPQATGFCGITPASSVALHQTMTELVSGESNGTSCVRAIDANGQHVGFVAFTPIMHRELAAGLHIYAQHPMHDVLPIAVQLGELLLPGFKLSMVGDDRQRALFESYGFATKTVFVQR